MSKYVRVGSVRRFDDVRPDKAQALKPLEEAAEVFGAWQTLNEELVFYDRSDEDPRVVNDKPSVRMAAGDLLDECADVVQATLNLVAALGVDDFRPYMDACEKRNRERGRITDGC